MASRTTGDLIATKAKLFRGFADPSRLSIVEALREGGMTVGEIMEATGLTQSNTSNHLACLFDCGLVGREQRGRFVRYELTDARVRVLLEQAEELLDEIAAGVVGCPLYVSSDADREINHASPCNGMESGYRGTNSAHVD